jgi:hypothetical protein
MKKKVFILFIVLLCLTSWAATPKTVIVAIYDVDGGSGPVEAGDYGFEAWVADRTDDVLDNNSPGCAILEVPEYSGGTYSGYCINIDAGNFSSWVNGESLHLKVWENDTPLSEQPQALKSFLLNNNPAQVFEPPDGITLYNPPLPVITPTPTDESTIASGDITTTNLNWATATGDNSTHFDIYLSTNLAAVTNLSASAQVEENVVFGDLPYDPLLGFSKTYYWRVVSKNNTSNITSNGTIWSFETLDEIIVQTVQNGSLNTFTFSGGETGGELIPATVGFTPTVSRNRDAGMVTVRKYEEPPATVPCPEYALNVIFDMDLSQYSGNQNVTISLEWQGIGFEGDNYNLYYYNGSWSTYIETTPVWDADGPDYSVEFTTANINTYVDVDNKTTWMIGDGSSSSPLQPAVPAISSAEKNGSNFQLTWGAASAASSYQVLSTSDLAAEPVSWFLEEGELAGTTWQQAFGYNERKFFKIIANGGGSLTSDESEISGYVKYTIQPTAGTDNNIIVYSMDMGLEDADGLMNTFSNCNMISRWNKNTQNFTSYLSGDTGANFDLQPGGVYMVSATATEDWYCCGIMHDALTYNLSTTSTTNLNWISVPLDQDVSNALDIINSSLDTISGQPFNRINFVSYYDVVDQVWKGYASYYPNSFNFAVTPGAGYQVNLTIGPYTWPVRGE